MNHAARTIAAIALLVVAQVATALPLAAPVAAAPGVEIMAGQYRQAGFSGDGGPATAAKLNSPRAIAADQDGSVFFIDSTNRRLRHIDPAGVIRTIFGDGVNCGAADPITHIVTNNGLCAIGGLTVGGDGALYYSVGGTIIRTTRDGQSTRFAGWNGFGPGNHMDGDKYVVRIAPEYLEYDPVSGNLYFTENHAVRAVTPAGQIVTLAGRTGNCNHGTADEISAMGACFWPRGIGVHEGVVYFVESSDWNGPRVRRIDGGVVRTVAGNSTWSQPTVGGPATSSGFTELADIQFDAPGNMYVGATSRGRIFKVATDNTLSLVTEFEGGAGWLAMDPTGNLIVSLNFRHQLAKITGLQSPKPLPKVSDIAPNAPVMADALLTRGVTIVPDQTSPAAAYYEYGWANSQTATQPATTLQRADGTQGTLRYHDASPDTDWWLMARGVLPTGETGPWSAPHKVHTPTAPSLIVLGDSISSGHHHDEDDNHVTDCDDENYGYAYVFSQKWRAELPTQWISSDAYVNQAHSGFATQRRPGSGIDGSVLEGGDNACDETVSRSPSEVATETLADHSGSWNRVLISAGINDTNWGDVVAGIIQIQLAEDFARTFIPIFLQLRGVGPDLMNEAACTHQIQSRWNGYSTSVKASITNGVNKIVTDIHTADPLARVDWLSYYNVAGTGTNALRLTPYFPEACGHPVDEAMAVVHGAVRGGLSADVSFVNTDTVMRHNDENMQPLYGFDTFFEEMRWFRRSDQPNPPGWPHPNERGAVAISSLLEP